MLEQLTLDEKSEKKSEKINNPEKWLMETGRFKAFEYPSSEQTSIEGQDVLEHYKKIEQNVPGKDRWMLKALVDYIKAPIIVDNFSSEDERNIWQETVAYKHPEVNSLFDLNKLKATVTGQILPIIEIAGSEGWLDSDLINRFKELDMEYRGSDPDSPRFNTIEFGIEEKIALVKKITNLAKDVYQAVAKRFHQEI